MNIPAHLLAEITDDVLLGMLNVGEYGDAYAINSHTQVWTSNENITTAA